MDRLFLKKIIGILALALVLTCQVALAAEGAKRTPLLMAGKKTLFQRVIIHPGSFKYTAPSQESKEGPLKPFTVLYVYSRQDSEGKSWLEVSPASNGTGMFWLPAEQSAEWQQALTLLFTERMGRDPVMFFREEKGLLQLCEAADIGAATQQLAASFQNYAAQGTAPADFPLIGMEPADAQGAVAASRFYIMPILDWKDPFEGTKFLRVASIDPGNQPPSAKDGGAAEQQGQGKDGTVTPFKTGIVFVLDTTISMKPYIDKSLEVAKAIYDKMEQEGVTDKVGLGVVAYRNSVKARSGVGYVTQIVSPFRDASQRKAFEEALANVKEAKVSTHDINEDAYAGLAAAVEEFDWSPYHSRVILLITDAGPLKADDPYASVKMRGPELGDVLKTHSISLVIAHVETPEGAKNHKYAEGEYLSLYGTQDRQQTGYIPIPAKNHAAAAAAFDAFATAMSQGFVDIVKKTAEGTPLDKPAEKAPEDLQDKGKWLADNLGYSMQLDYIGEKKGNRAPSVVSSWIADMDLARLAHNRRTESVEVAVLLTKGQLSALQKQLSIVVDNAERTKTTGAKDFFQSIVSAAAQMTRDPNQFTAAPGQSLQSLGVLGEFLDGLPYKSQILQMTEEDWNNMNLGQQTQFINRLKSRIARYSEYEKDRDNWESFGAVDSNDWVYRVPLSMLP